MAGGGAQLHVAHSVRDVVASAAHTATEATDVVFLPVAERGFIFIYDYTVNAVLAGDTCDVYVQTMLDGTNWTDVVHFPQVLGNDAAGRRHAKVLTAGVLLEGDNTAALAAGQVRHALGDEWRVNVVIAGGNPSFTFSVTAIPV